MSNKVEVQHLEEGNEIVVNPSRNDVGIVEDVQPAPWRGKGTGGRTVITMCDGRTFTVPSDFLVTVLS